MKQYFTTKCIGIIFVLLAFVSCDPNNITDEDPASEISAETLEINEWIDGIMNEVYLWNTKIPSSVNYKQEADPAELFDKMLYKEEDRWSWITDNWSALQDELKGTPVSMGFAPAFYYKDSETTDVITIIKYVYKDSPAEKAGLKRGDIILTYNGVTPNDGNYYDLCSGNSYTVGLGTYSSEQKSYVSNGVEITISALSFDANPVQHYEVKEIEGYKIGYFVYTDFTEGVNGAYLDSIDSAMDYFKANGVSNVIVDLRYNPGGELGTAAHLASALAPRSVVEGDKVLVKMVYNKNVQDYFEQKEDDSNLNYRFPANSSNLNLNKVYFLTTKGTASASELVMIGLKPYMDVVMVGDTTYGKYTGAWVLPDTNDPQKHNWCMLPIVSKFSNISGFTNFKDGIAPDVYVRDYLVPAYPFGDLNDDVFATAIEHITGVPVNTTKSAISRKTLKELHPKQMEIKKTMLLPAVSNFQ